MWRKLMFVSALGAFAGSAIAAGCFDYGPIQLSGTLVRQTYAGPPDYESVTKGDRPIVIYVLQLDSTLCVADSRIVGLGTRELQLEWSAGDPASFLGKKVTVTGELTRGGAQHDNRFVIIASRITT
jgi:hypothetical protein